MPITQRLRFEQLETRDMPAVTLRLDYRFDTTGFFNDPSRQAAAQAAADAIEPFLQDNLTAIVPSGGDTWNVQYRNPANNQIISLPNQIIPANEIPIYMIGAPLGGTELGLAASGSVSAAGSASWLQTVFGRGQAGATATPVSDFAPWGGFVSIDSLTTWSFNLLPTVLPTQFDFTSVAQHEIVHLLGFTDDNPSFARFISGGRFNGPNAVASFGGPVPVTLDGHFAQSVTSGGTGDTMVPVLPAGTIQRLTPLDQAALRDIGWQSSASATSPSSPTSPTSPTSPLSPLPAAPTTPKSIGLFAVGTGPGRQDVTVYNPDQTVLFTIRPFAEDFTGGVRVAVGDVNADGFPDLIVGTGPGIATRVRIFSGLTRAELFSVAPFESSFTGGVYVATGDLDGDGRADIVITPDEGGGPRVRVFRGGDFAPTADFLGIEDPNFRGGARAAVADINGDRIGDLVVAAGFGGGPRVAAFDGASLNRPNRIKIFSDFLAFEESLRNGAFVAAGDIDGDGYADLIAGGGPGGGPRISAFNGKTLAIRNGRDRFVDFLAGAESDRSGIRVAVKDLDGDEKADIVAGGTGVAAFAGSNLGAGKPPTFFGIDAFPNFQGGVFVG